MFIITFGQSNTGHNKLWFQHFNLGKYLSQLEKEEESSNKLQDEASRENQVIKKQEKRVRNNNYI